LARLVAAFALAPAALAVENATEVATTTPAGSVAEEMLPPLVEFQGKAPKLKVFPGGTKDKESTWYMLEFGAVEEVDSAGKKVSDRSIPSLAAEKSITWSQESTLVNGTGATKTRMELYLNETFKQACKGGKGRLPDNQSFISIETFVFSGAATIEYGNETLEVVASSLKYNVRSTNWPFCDEGNSLDVKVKGDKPPKMEEKDMAKEAEARMKSGKKGKGVKGKKFKANAGKRDLEMDLPTLVLVDGVLTDSEVEMDAKGTKTSITFSFPHFNQTLLYDPTAGLEEPASDSTSIDGGAASDSGARSDSGEASDSGAADVGAEAGASGGNASDGAIADSAATVSLVVAPVVCLSMLLHFGAVR